MSHSPDKENPSLRKYLAGWRASGQLLRQGRSWSGRERHCAFLNQGSSTDRFANVSAVTGLDHPDDGRALALVDWDHDGDLDFWFANRTAPRLRLMINQLRTGDARHVGGNRDFVALRLLGRTCNRDAVGSRVVLSHAVDPHADSTPSVSIATVRAGDGFLSQSSKWLHFGLARRKVDSVVVHWPDGPVERFGNVVAGGRFILEQGSGKAVAWQPSVMNRKGTRNVQLKPVKQVLPKTTETARVWLPDAVPLPRLPYRSLSGIGAKNVDVQSRPLLINLWASWCLPCLAELKQFAEGSQRLRTVGVDVLALSLDGLDPDRHTNAEDAAELLQRLDFPFNAGVATGDLLEKLDLINGFLFDRAPNLGVPTSLLLDREGRLAAIYRGPLHLDQLLADVEHLSDTGNARRAESVPFPGKWHLPLGNLELESLANLFSRNHPGDEIFYLQKLLETQADEPRLHYRLSQAHGRGHDRDNAVRHLRQVVRLAPDSIAALNDLAWWLATGPPLDALQQGEVIRIAEHAAELTRHENPGILDTLAAAYAAAERFDEAVTTAETAVRLASKANRADIAQAIQRRLELYRQSKRFREHSARGGVN